MREAPVGVFDSGVGGLSVLKKVRRALPDAPVIRAVNRLIADAVDAPVSARSPEQSTLPL